MWLFFTLKKKIRGNETLTHTFSKMIGDKTNQNNNNKKIDRRTQLKGKYIKKLHTIPLPMDCPN